MEISDCRFPRLGNELDQVFTNAIARGSQRNSRGERHFEY